MYSRQSIWTGQQPQPQDLMQFERDAAKSLSQFILAAMGSQNSAFWQLPATPGTGLTVNIGAGAVFQYGEIDPTAWSDTMGSDAFESMLLGLVLSSQNLTGFAAPTTSGDSINYLIQCQIQVTDSAATNIPFYSSNNNPPTYVSKSPSRQNVVVFEVKAGTQAATGTQTTPTPDAGWIPLYAVTVDYGETSLTSADIVAAANAPQFYGFVHTNPNGNTPVYLSPAAQQSGFLNISGNATVGTIIATDALFGGASATTNFDGTWKNGFAGDYLNLTATGFTGSKQATDSLNIAGSIGYTGPHAGTDADPIPLSQLNVSMLGGKVASDYALASGHYIILYAGTPTADPTNVNAAIGGYFQVNVASGTAPIQVVSTTMCPNLNAQFVGGYTPGNASGDVPISNGTLNTNLNAQYLNGKADTAFQPAGSYAEMGSENTGDFSVSGQFFSYGGTASQQISLGYMASNSFGINGGGAMAYVNSFTAPLALIGPSVRTDGPLYVGDSTPQNAHVQDIIPSGLVRSGIATYRVTRGPSYSQNPAPLAPGQGTDYGYYPSMGGGISLPSQGVQETITFRMLITLASSLNFTFNFRANDALSVYIDGAFKYSNSGSGAIDCVYGVTLGAGTHTLDITYSGDGTGGDDHFLLFPFFPMPGGQVSSAITKAIPG